MRQKPRTNADREVRWYRKGMASEIAGLSLMLMLSVFVICVVAFQIVHGFVEYFFPGLVFDLLDYSDLRLMLFVMTPLLIAAASIPLIYRWCKELVISRRIVRRRLFGSCLHCGYRFGEGRVNRCPECGNIQGSRLTELRELIATHSERPS